MPQAFASTINSIQSASPIVSFLSSTNNTEKKKKKKKKNNNNNESNETRKSAPRMTKSRTHFFSSSSPLLPFLFQCRRKSFSSASSEARRSPGSTSSSSSSTTTSMLSEKAFESCALSFLVFSFAFFASLCEENEGESSLRSEKPPFPLLLLLLSVFFSRFCLSFFASSSFGPLSRKKSARATKLFAGARAFSISTLRLPAERFRDEREERREKVPSFSTAFLDDARKHARICIYMYMCK